VYLAHFKRCADEGVAATMTAYNSVNGEWCGQNANLLEDVLRETWHWSGITVSDFVFGLRDGRPSRVRAAGSSQRSSGRMPPGSTTTPTTR
jgi:beta-glucosidase